MPSCPIGASVARSCADRRPVVSRLGGDTSSRSSRFLSFASAEAPYLASFKRRDWGGGVPIRQVACRSRFVRMRERGESAPSQAVRRARRGGSDQGVRTMVAPGGAADRGRPSRRVSIGRHPRRPVSGSNTPGGLRERQGGRAVRGGRPATPRGRLRPYSQGADGCKRADPEVGSNCNGTDADWSCLEARLASGYARSPFGSSCSAFRRRPRA